MTLLFRWFNGQYQKTLQGRDEATSCIVERQHPTALSSHSEREARVILFDRFYVLAAQTST
eukprot:3917387-Amphidinium_carterae.1